MNCSRRLGSAGLNDEFFVGVAAVDVESRQSHLSSDVFEMNRTKFNGWSRPFTEVEDCTAIVTADAISKPESNRKTLEVDIAGL